MHLNAFISRTGFCSRRKAALLVKEGRVKVNNKTVITPWLGVSGADDITVNEKPVALKEHIYLMLNKPKGVTTTLSDRFAKKTVIDLIPRSFGRLYPVGRLDKNSRGLIILTNDGAICHKLTHPKFETEKEYSVLLKGKIDDGVLVSLKKGVRDGHDLLKIKSAIIDKTEAGKTLLTVIICEGKKRHLRRLFKRAGFPVLDLVRTRVGSLRLGNLGEGRFKMISRDLINN